MRRAMTLMMKLDAILPVVLLLMLAGISACTTSPTIEAEKLPPGSLPAATSLEQSGNFSEAAHEYLRAAQQAQPPQKQLFQLRAVSALLQGNLLIRARALLERIDTSTQGIDLQQEQRLLQAQLLLQEHQPLEALELTASLPRDASAALRVRHHTLRAQAYDMAGNLLESMRERILLEPLLPDEQRRYENQKTLWYAAMQLTPLALEHLRTTPPPDILSGWMELAWITKTSRQAPDEFQSQLSDWKQQYPQHPANWRMLDELQQRYQQSLRRPATIALLLPLSGNLATAGSAIRDGFLAAHLRDKGGSASRILIYDSQDQQQGGDIEALYRQAAAAGAEIIVGPLDKDAVTRLAGTAGLTVPVLALNQTEAGSPSPQGFFQFSLAPEDEARQVAARAMTEGLTRAIVMVPDGEWGRRLEAAFAERFVQLGGRILEQEFYNPQNSDFSRPIQKLLNLNESQQRYNELKGLLGGDIKFEPRRRQDTDFIFMAGFPQQARLIVPQLRFHRAADLPVYTTSHAYGGIQDTRNNHDMDGVIFCDTPWTLLGPRHHPLHEELTGLWPDRMERYSRLYALGIDAYQLIPHLEWLRNEPYERLAGETGDLYIDSNNLVHRSLRWARFVNGTAKLIQQNLIPAQLNPGGPALQSIQ